MAYNDVLTAEEAGLLALHRQRTDATLADQITAWQTREPEYHQLRAQLRAIEPASLVSLLAWILDTVATEKWNGRRHVVLIHVAEILISRSLPYTSEDAVLIVALAAASPGRHAVRAALKAAERVGPSRELDHALLRLLATAETVSPVHLGGIIDLLPRVRERLSRDTSDLDLSVLGLDDHWGPAARDLLVTWLASDPAAGHLVSLLARPKSQSPQTSWLAQCAELLANRPRLVILVHDLVRLVTEIDLTETSEKTHGFYAAPLLLLGEANSILVRSAVWLMRFVDQADRFELLGHVALRCGAANPGHYAGGVSVTVPLAPKVAYAAVDTLAALDIPEARAQLASIFDEARLAPIVRRAGRALGRDEAEIRSRLAQHRTGRRPRVTRPRGS